MSQAVEFVDTVSSVSVGRRNGHPALALAFVTVLSSHSVAQAYQGRDLAEDLLADIITSQVPPSSFTAFNEHPLSEQHRRNLELASLIQTWLDDDSGYDEQVGPELDRILRENPFRLRE
jgi:hypothetical protein